MARETFEDFVEMASTLLAGHEGLEELQQANDCINLALQIRPHDGSAWILKGYIMSCLGDDAAALASAEMAGRDLPEDPEVYYVKATALGDMALFQPALDAVDVAFEHLTNGRGDEWLLEDLYFLKGSLLEATGHGQEARSTYEQGLGQCPESILLRDAAEPLHRDERRRTFTVIDGGR